MKLLLSPKVLTSILCASNHKEPKEDWWFLYSNGSVSFNSITSLLRECWALGIWASFPIQLSTPWQLDPLLLQASLIFPLSSFLLGICLTSGAFVIVYYSLISGFSLSLCLLIFLGLSAFPLCTKFSFHSRFPLNSDLLFGSFLGYWISSLSTLSIFSFHYLTF